MTPHHRIPAKKFHFELNVKAWRALCRIVVLLSIFLPWHAQAQVGELNHLLRNHGISSTAINNSGNDSVRAMAVYPGASASHAGKIVLAGDGWEYPAKPQYVTTVVRLNANGTVDTTFNGTGIQKVDFGEAWGANFCQAVIVQPDDKIIVLAQHRASPTAQVALARFNANGSLDTTFDGDGVLITTLGGVSTYISAIAIQKDGKIVLCGATGTGNSCVARLAANGSSPEFMTVDMTTFIGGGGGQEAFNSVTLDDAASGAQCIYVTGSAETSSGGKHRATAIKLNPDSFSTSVIPWKQAFDFAGPGFGSAGGDIAYHDFGGATGQKVVIGGGQGGNFANNFTEFGLAVLNPSNGALFTGFSTDGKATVNVSNHTYCERMAIQSDHKIIVGGNVNGSFGCARFNPDGTLDTSFTDDGIVSYTHSSFGQAAEFCLDNNGDLVASYKTYNSNSTISYFSAIGIHTRDKAMEYSITENSQVTDPISLNQTGGILCLNVCVDGKTSPMNATSFTFNTTGSTNPATDIASARLYFTGASSAFSTATPLGAPVAAPNGSFTISPTQPLAHGDNYFWLAYTLTGSPTPGNVVDAQCTAVTVGGSSKTPSPAAPAGSRTISTPSYPDIWGDTSTDWVSNVTFAGINNNTVAVAGGYDDQTAVAGSVTAGTSAPFSCTNQGDWPSYPSSLVVWCDWNQNYSFDDPGEGYLVASNVTAAGPHTLSIGVPADALAGRTRMRVVTYWDQGQSPPNQGDLAYGEAEDYTLNVSAANPAPTAPSNPGATGQQTSQITWTWTDNSTNETGFKVWADPGADAPTTLRTTTAAGATQWTMATLSANTQYAFKVAAAGSGGDSAATTPFSAWTAIEAVSGLAFSNVGATAIDVAAGNTPGNLSSGSSGLYFANATAGANSGWQQSAAAWRSSGLTPNTTYSFSGASRNGAGAATAAATASRATLAGPPSLGNNISCDRSTSTGYPAGTAFTFNNPAGFGSGTHGGSAYKASGFQYAWNTSASHAFTGSESLWNSGSLALTPVASGNYYLHLQSLNSEGAPNATTLDYGPFRADTDAPAVSSVSVPASGLYVAGQNLDFTINFSENVTVNTGGGMPGLTLELNTGGTVSAGYISGSGSNALVFRYTMDDGNVDNDGITINALALNGGTIRDAAGNNASLTLNSVGSTSGVRIDTVAPGAPGTPAAPSAVVTNTTVGFTWTAASDATGSGVASYECQIGASAGASDVYSGNVGNVLSKSITGSFGTTYYCRVRAIDAAGNAGAWSANSAGVLAAEAVTITTPPASQTVDPGDSVMLSVAASGTAPLSYQWKKGSDTLTGETAATLTIASASEADEGSYTCLVTNPAGTVESAAATLTVNDPPSILTHPAPQMLDPGVTVSFTVATSGTTPLTHQWQKDGSPLANGGRISGAATAALSITNLVMTDAGAYRCVVTNSAGEAQSQAARLTVNPTLTVVSAHGAPDPAVGAHVMTTGTLVNASVSGSPELDTTGTTRFVATGWMGGGSVSASGATTQTSFNLALDSTLSWQWKTQHQVAATASPAEGGAVTLADGITAANGSWHDSGTTATLRALPAAGYAFGGWSGALAGAATSASLSMNGPCAVTATFIQIPHLTRQPEARFVNPGATVTFEVEAGGTPVLAYAWRKDGAPLGEGARITDVATARLTITDARQSDEGNYSCVVTNDGGSTESLAVALIVNDAPVVTPGAPAGYVENAAPAAIAPELTVSDVDHTNLAGAVVTIAAGLTAGDALSFTPQGGISGGYNATSGTLTLSGAASLADYQAVLRSVAFASTSEDPARSAASRGIRFVVSDGWRESAPEQVTMAVTAVNDNPDSLSLSGAVIEENQAAGTAIGDFSATDPDSADTHVYELVSGAGDADNASFAIAGGQLRSATAFDFEAKAAYAIRVRASDGHGGAFERAFTISVNDANDAPTALALDHAAINENATTGTLVGALSASDQDGADTPAFELAPGAGDADNGSFMIDGTALKTARVFDHEVQSSATVRLRASDGRGGACERAFVIAIVDQNEGPTAVADLYSADENTTLSVAAPGVLANDADPDSSDTLRVTAFDPVTSLGAPVAVGGDGGFVYDPTSIAALQALAAGETTTDTFRLTIADSSDSTATCAVTIALAGRNDAPTGLALDNAMVAENASAGTVVGSFIVQDRDGADTHTLELVSGAGDADNASFIVEGDQLKTAAAFDYESKSAYAIRVRASDGHGGSFERAFTITVSDANDVPSAIQLSNARLAENQAAGVSIGAFTVSDQDAGDIPAFTLAAGAGDADNARFVIEGNTLKSAESFDFEARTAYQVRVRAADGQGGAFEQAFTISITDANDAPTAVALSHAALDENQPAGSVVGVLSATDQDTADTHTYELVSGAGDADNAAFAIVGGQLRSAAPLDFEAKSSYSVRVRAGDGRGGAFEQAFTISVNDANDAPTGLVLDNAFVDENATTGTLVGTLSASDQDGADALAYALSPGEGDSDNASFAIDGALLKTVRVFDYESQTSATVRLRVSDGRGGAQDRILVIQIRDLNEDPTALDLSGASVAENQPAGTPIGALAVTDLDSTGSYAFTLASGVGDADNAAFSITSATLLSAAAFDFETKSTYSIRVRVEDGRGGFLERPFTVAITDANDAPTTLTLDRAGVDENQPSGTIVGRLDAADQDDGDTHAYSLVAGAGGDDNGMFLIVDNMLKTAAGFDFETKSAYAIRVRAGDGRGGSIERSFTIQVNDLNDAPMAIALSNASIAENQPAGTLVGTLSATDQDTSDTQVYTLTPGAGDADNASFTIVEHALKSAAVFDHEAQAAYSVRVRVSDGRGGMFEQAFTVQVADANDAPTALALDHNIVDENAPAGALVGELSASDQDAADTVSFELSSGAGDADNGSFTIAGNQLRTAASFDFETKPGASVRVRVSDGKGGSFERAFAIVIRNLNEAPTGLTLSAASVAENKPAGTLVGTLAATDPDTTDTQAFELVAGAGGEDNAAFAIVGEQLRTAAAFDFETKRTYAVRVRASDGQGGACEQAFTIQVSDANDAPTALALSHAAIDENQSAGAVVGALSANDQDTSDALTYTLAAGEGDTDNGSFSIVGEQLRAASAFDYEAKALYTARLRVSDGRGGALERAFVIQVRDLNEPPLARADLFTADEDATLTVAAPGVLLNDEDPDATDTLRVVSFAPLSQHGAPLAVAADGGFVYDPTAVASLQALAAGQSLTDAFNLTIADASGSTATCTVTINLDGRNDAPTALALDQTAIAENQGAGAVVGTFSIQDRDAADTHTLELASGAGDADNASFRIEGDRLKTAAAFDFEAKPSCSIRVRVSDGRGSSFERVFTINVTDQNDAPSALGLSGTSVTENLPAGTAVGTLSVTDQDPTNLHTFALAPGPGDADNAAFTIQGAVLKTAVSFNFEEKSSRLIRVRASDDQGGTYEQAFMITIADANDAPTALALSHAAISENQPAGAVVGLFSASDQDTSDALTYTLTAGEGDADNGSFAIVGEQLRTAAAFDYEAKASYAVRVRVSDGRGGSVEQRFAIAVNNANDAPTGLALDNAAVEENATTGTLVGRLAASDQDGSDTLAYTLTPGEGATDNSSFIIAGDLLKTARVFDHETQSSATVRLRVSDGKGGSQDRICVIAIRNLNENPTALTLSSLSVTENQPAGTAIGMLAASDPDSTGSYAFTLAPGAGSADNAAFTITSGTLRSAAAFDFETKSSYAIRVRVEDGLGGFLERAFRIDVTDVNDPPTALTLDHASVDENQAAGALVGRLGTVDQDGGDTQAYSLVAGAGGSGNGLFTIQGDQLQTAARFDYETAASYSIRVRVSDGSGSAFERIFTIQVGDLNDAPTAIALGNASIAENQPAGTLVGTLSATDQDTSDTQVYTLTPGAGDADNASFTIVEHALKSAAVFDHEAQAAYSVRVRVSDGRGGMFEQAFTVQVADANDAPTALALDHNIVDENAPAGALVGELSASDQDAADTVSFELSSGAGDADNGSFTIAGNQLRTAASFDFETKPGASVRVRVSDGKGGSFERAFAIVIRNLNEAPTGLTLSAASVAENKPAGTLVGTLAATDPDTTDTQTFELAAGAGGEDNGAFAIVGEQLRTAAAFDYEAKPAYAVRVRASDGQGGACEQAFTIQVTDANDAPSALSLDSLAIDENATTGTLVGRLAASDQDGSDTLTFELTNGAGDRDNGSFTVLGERLQTARVLDHEAQSSATVRLRVSDGRGGALERAFVIQVRDLNDPPLARADLFTADEDATLTVAAPGVLLNDEDPDATDTLRVIEYETHSALGGSVRMTADGGFVYNASALPQVQALAAGQTLPDSVNYLVADQSGTTATAQVRLTILGRNDAPTALALDQAAIAENKPAGTPVGRFSATDIDAGESFTYALVSGPGDSGNTFFTIAGDRLLTTQPLDYETQANYSVQVRVTDGHGATFEQAFTIRVTDANDAPTAIQLSNARLAENQPAGAAIGLFTGSDQDPGDTPVFTLAGGAGDADNARFTIEGNTLKSAESFDFESKSVLSIRVRVEDGRGGVFEQPFTIAVDNVNEAPATLTLSGSGIAENLPAGTLVGRLTANDPDAGDALTYTFAAGPGDSGNNAFAIEGDNLVTVASFDYETSASRTIRVRVSDAGGKTLEQVFAISVIDANDAPMDLTLTNAAAPEKQPAGALVGAFRTIDPDATDTHAYALVAGAGDADNGRFLIQGARLLTAAAFDAQKEAGPFSIRVETNDGRGGRFARQFSIALTPAADTEPPVFTAGPSVVMLSSRRAIIGWETSEPARATLGYGTSAALGTTITLTQAERTQQVELNNLTSQTQYFVQVATTDEAGNGPVRSALLTFTTPADPDLDAPVVSEGPLATSVNDTYAEIRWTTNEAATSKVIFSGGETSSAREDFSLTQRHSLLLTGLKPATLYTYTVETVDANGNGPTRVGPLTFRTLPTPDTLQPVITEGPLVVGLGDHSATIAWRTDEPATGVVEWGTTSSTLTAQAASAVLTQSHQMTLNNLSPGTRHWFRVRSYDAYGNGPTSSTLTSFTTEVAVDRTPPRILEGPAVISIADRTTTIRWRTDEPADSVVVYGADGVLQTRHADPARVTEHQLTLVNLTPGTRYRFVISSTDAGGNTVTSGAAVPEVKLAAFQATQPVTSPAPEPQSEFQTLALPDLAPPVFTDGPKVASFGDDWAIVTWTTNEIGDERLLYGVAGEEMTHFVGEINRNFEHYIILTNLSPGAQYQYRVTTQDVSGNTAQSEVLTLTTAALPDTQAPAILDGPAVQPGTTSARVNWQTSELSTSQVEFGDAPGNLVRISATGGIRSSHEIYLNNLDEGTTYYYAVVSTDSSGNTKRSAVASFTTAVTPLPADLGVALALSQTTATAGDQLDAVFHLANLGAQAVEEPELTVTLPASMHPLSVDTASSHTFVPNATGCLIGLDRLAAGQTVTVTLRLQVDSALTTSATPLAIGGSLAASDPGWIDPNPANNTAQAILSFVTPVGAIQITSDLVTLSPWKRVPSWRLTGPAGWVAEGRTAQTFTPRPVGQYTLTWLPVEGWITPPPQTQTLARQGESIAFDALYQPDSVGCLAMTVKSGAHYQAGGQILVHWTSKLPVTGTAVIFELWRDQQLVASLGSAWSVTCQGDVKLTIPTFVPAGSTYRVRMKSSWDPAFWIDNGMPLTIQGRAAVTPEGWMAYE